MVHACYRLRMTRQLAATCTECMTSVALTVKARIDSFHRTGRTYCSDACRDNWVARDRSERMARTNRQHASARMKTNNPMAKPESRAKMTETIRRIEHKPRTRGGNGSGVVSMPQRLLAEALGWPMEVIVAPHDSQRPFHYKLDMANAAMKICVEVDGSSHTSLVRQSADRRRDARLRAIGWITLRFSNRDAMERTAECARTVWSITSKWQERTPIS
jgi:hypothetical protein